MSTRVHRKGDSSKLHVRVLDTATGKVAETNASGVSEALVEAKRLLGIPRQTPKEEGALHSWREIAAYIGKSVRTVQRWESLLGFPVHKNGNSEVVAYRHELDAWTRRGFAAADHAAGNTVRDTNIAELHQRSSQLRDQAAKKIAAVSETFERTKRIYKNRYTAQS